MYVMRWNGEQCPGNPCRFIRNIQNAMNSAHWQSQERLQKWNKDRDKINWSLFQDYLNYESKPLQRSTNPKESYMKSFKIKLFLDELPMMENMYKRNKKKYKSDICQRCLKNVETNNHWIEYQDNEVSKYRLIYDMVSKILIKVNNFTEHKVQELTGILNKNKDKEDHEIKPLAGIMTKIAKREVNALGKEIKGKRNFCCYVLHKMNKNLNKHIWKRRCIYIAAISDELIQEKTESEQQETREENINEKRKEVIDRTYRKMDI
ncbi:hypothetical protein C2G38_2043063 [Gigaspora rosea]|uniref:Uncharacterized protein n=1 Tax=Gigaspora rosea TaxID=44941 RepID=A0A397UP60_9GLOM|nr:hypothetical protein C2G38_2043063 [Gigaspora rosea]